MSELMIGGGLAHIEPTEFNGLYDVAISCACCKARITKETWVNKPQTPTYAMSSPANYIRIIFGIHPEIHSAQRGSVPAVFTPAYFCKECEERYYIVVSLLKIFLSFEPMIHPSASDSQFDPQRGCWITIWPLDTQSQPTWPIDYQVDLSTFREITEKMLNIPGNPFRVFRR